MQPARQPAGTAMGGQFAPMYRAEAPLSLAGPATGSYRFPPEISDTDEYVNWWSNVEIEDDTCQAFESNYVRHWRQWTNEKVSAWEKENPRPGNERDGATWDGYRANAVQSYSSMRPPIFRDQIRPLARIRGMAVMVAQLPVEGQQRVLSQQVRLPGNVIDTVGGIADKYHLRSFHANYDLDAHDREVRTASYLERIATSNDAIELEQMYGPHNWATE
ncbi:hypothetical protein FB459_2192 [Yimella lutea]|uniref:Uncharacterized protein n=1 Tax=Yimella lutea TaxID=587872 RepID=A0A542EH81_9MICO|nr:hypothetical protein [Yimella lutea]TQJ14692.1 hypothetical protein FB459_2192 [Yimella lutea]